MDSIKLTKIRTKTSTASANAHLFAYKLAIDFSLSISQRRYDFRCFGTEKSKNNQHASQ